MEDIPSLYPNFLQPSSIIRIISLQRSECNGHRRRSLLAAEEQNSLALACLLYRFQGWHSCTSQAHTSLTQASRWGHETPFHLLLILACNTLKVSPRSPHAINLLPKRICWWLWRRSWGGARRRWGYNRGVSSMVWAGRDSEDPACQLPLPHCMMPSVVLWWSKQIWHVPLYSPLQESQAKENSRFSNYPVSGCCYGSLNPNKSWSIINIQVTNISVHPSIHLTLTNDFG